MTAPPSPKIPKKCSDLIKILCLIHLPNKDLNILPSFPEVLEEDKILKPIPIIQAISYQQNKLNLSQILPLLLYN